MNSIFPVWFYFVNSRTITKVQLKTWEVSRPSRVFGAFIPICPNLRRKIILTITFSEYVSWHSPTIATDNQNPFSAEFWTFTYDLLFRVVFLHCGSIPPMSTEASGCLLFSTKRSFLICGKIWYVSIPPALSSSYLPLLENSLMSVWKYVACVLLFVPSVVAFLFGTKLTKIMLQRVVLSMFPSLWFDGL